MKIEQILKKFNREELEILIGHDIRKIEEEMKQKNLYRTVTFYDQKMYGYVLELNKKNEIICKIQESSEIDFLKDATFNYRDKDGDIKNGRLK
jgi:hypothetical protein